jgi:hypothetical protein
VSSSFLVLKVAAAAAVVVVVVVVVDAVVCVCFQDVLFVDSAVGSHHRSAVVVSIAIDTP